MRFLRLLTLSLASACLLCAGAKGVTVSAYKLPAAGVFARIMAQTGTNFVYPSELLRNLEVTVYAKDLPLTEVLDKIFADTDITYKIKGKNVTLSRRKRQAQFTVSGYVREEGTGEALIGARIYNPDTRRATATNAAGFYSITLPAGSRSLSVTFPGFLPENRTINISSTSTQNFSLADITDENSTELHELVVTADKNRTISMQSSDVGHVNLSRHDITATPTIFGEADVIKSLQLQPGVSAGTEGLAGMYVHGGNHDENLYMLDNIPLYQINHLGGLFSAFNAEAIKNVDFYKSTFPARYDGRLSSVMDVHTKDGSLEEHHGSFKLGLTSGALNIDGPIWKGHTSYSLAVRRSWFEILSVPAMAIFNQVRQDHETAKTIAQYSFMDINAKINHHFSDRSQLYAMFYYGDDYLKGGTKYHYLYEEGDETRQKDISRLKWGNLVASLGWNFKLSPTLFGEFTAAYTHYRSSLKRDEEREAVYAGNGIVEDAIENNRRIYETRNDIHDWTFRTDFGWNPSSANRAIFGANFTLHSYTPQNDFARHFIQGEEISNALEIARIKASETNLYAGDDWDIIDPLRLSLGTSLSLFHIDSHNHLSLNPRASLRWLLNDRVTLKAAYSRMAQYVHQLTSSSLSLPTDQWVPIAGNLPPQHSDKISLGAYWEFADGDYGFNGEVFYKWMRNIVDYRDDWSLIPANAPWVDRLCTGKGTSKGVDLMLSRRAGKFTGHIAYSLLWADRQFDLKNGGHRFPSRYDNRHKINILLNWRINEKWEVNASWTGMSGNMVTLSAQDYELLKADNLPYFGKFYDEFLDLNAPTNNLRLPFYHRLDVGANRYTRHGMWNFSLYNAYSYMNVISVRKDYNIWILNDNHFRALRLLPIIPSVSYTWFF